MPIALALIPLLPGLVNSILNIVNAVKDDPATPEEAKLKLATISADLKVVLANVLAAELPSGQ
jgi:hypothetical protein